MLNFIQNNNVNLVDITVSSYCTKVKNDWPQNLLKYEYTQSYFASDDLPDIEICFDFKNHPAIPTYYTIRISNYGANLSHLRSWAIEGSNNLQSWTVLDQRSNCSYLNGSSKLYSFQMNANQNSYRFLRIRQTVPNWRNRNYLKMNCI